MTMQLQPARLPKSGLSRDQTDERAFDVQMVKSVLSFCAKARAAKTDAELLKAAREFDWLASVLVKRAKAARLDATKLAWSSQLQIPASCTTAAKVFSNYFLAAFGLYVKPGRDRPRVMCYRSATPVAYGRTRKWIDGQLDCLYIYQRLRLNESGVARVTVPLLTTVDRCVAYVIFLLIENKWGLGDRIKICPFDLKSDDGDRRWLVSYHLFLDFRLDRDGKYKRGRQQGFCGPNHAMAQKMRDMRLRQKREITL